MAKCTVINNPVINLELTLDEAVWLKSLLGWHIVGDNSARKHVESIYEALNDGNLPQGRALKVKPESDTVYLLQ